MNTSSYRQVLNKKVVVLNKMKSKCKKRQFANKVLNISTSSLQDLDNAPCRVSEFIGGLGGGMNLLLILHACY